MKHKCKLFLTSLIIFSLFVTNPISAKASETAVDNSQESEELSEMEFIMHESQAHLSTFWDKEVLQSHQNPDGSTGFICEGGVIINRSPDGSMEAVDSKGNIYKKDTTGNTHVTFPDGSSMNYSAEGQLKYFDTDGTYCELNPDNSYTELVPGGLCRQISAAGDETWTIDGGTGELVFHEDGTVTGEIGAGEGGSLSFYDNTFHMEDGSGMTADVHIGSEEDEDYYSISLTCGDFTSFTEVNGDGSGHQDIVSSQGEFHTSAALGEDGNLHSYSTMKTTDGSLDFTQKDGVTMGTININNPDGSYIHASMATDTATGKDICIRESYDAATDTYYQYKIMDNQSILLSARVHNEETGTTLIVSGNNTVIYGENGSYVKGTRDTNGQFVPEYGYSVENGGTLMTYADGKITTQENVGRYEGEIPSILEQARITMGDNVPAYTNPLPESSTSSSDGYEDGFAEVENQKSANSDIAILNDYVNTGGSLNPFASEPAGGDVSATFDAFGFDDENFGISVTCVKDSLVLVSEEQKNGETIRTYTCTAVPGEKTIIMGYSSNYSAEHYAAIVPYKDGKAQTPIEALDSGSANAAAIYTVEEGLSGLCGLFTYKNHDNKASLSVVIIYQLAD